MKIEIIDGVEIDISGPLRKLRLKDGWYVVGEGSLDTVDSNILQPRRWSKNDIQLEMTSLNSHFARI
jgi:hypothetical protein